MRFYIEEKLQIIWQISMFLSITEGKKEKVGAGNEMEMEPSL